MNNFTNNSTTLSVSFQRAFDYISRRDTLPEWTNAFPVVKDRKATLRTPKGDVEVELDVDASRESGTIDWRWRLPDGSLGTAYSRLSALNDDATAYVFILPISPEQQDMREAMRTTIDDELKRLKSILAGSGVSSEK